MSALADRRRANAPSAGTSEPVFVASLTSLQPVPYMKPVRDRRPQELRKICRYTCNRLPIRCGEDRH